MRLFDPADRKKVRYLMMLNEELSDASVEHIARLTGKKL